MPTAARDDQRPDDTPNRFTAEQVHAWLMLI